MMNDSCQKTAEQISKDLFPTAAWNLISENRTNDDLIILDVSTPREFENLHLEGALNVSLFSRSFKNHLSIMDRSKTYMVYCKLGGRSKVAQKLMRQAGFQTVYNITGGTLFWKEAGLPFASGADGKNRMSFCPFFISIVAIKKIKKISQAFLSRIVRNNGNVSSSGQES